MSPTRLIGLIAVLSLAGPVALRAQGPAEGRGLLIGVAELASMLDSPQLVLLHVGDRAEYDGAHIPGARYVQLSDISAPRSSDPNALTLELPEPAALLDALRSFGVSDDSRIVVYFGSDWVTPATRVMLTLQWAGLGERSRLLDGGLNAWREAGQPVTDAAAPAKAGRLSALRTQAVVVTAAEVRERLDDERYAIVDARAPRFYEGSYEERGGERPGRIAGARSIPFTDVVDEALRMKDADALRALFRQAGVEASDTVIAYCHIGQQATAVVFAARLIGQPVVLYDGSYTEWGRRAELPIEKGAGGGAEAAAGPAGATAAEPAAERSYLPRLLASPLLNARAGAGASR